VEVYLLRLFFQPKKLKMLTPVQEVEILQAFGYTWLSKKYIVKPVARHLLRYDTTTKKICNVFKGKIEVMIYDSTILDTENYETFVSSLLDYEAYTRYNVGKSKPYNLLEFSINKIANKL
jgi:hypothetical protein